MTVIDDSGRKKKSKCDGYILPFDHFNNLTVFSRIWKSSPQDRYDYVCGRLALQSEALRQRMSHTTPSDILASVSFQEVPLKHQNLDHIDRQPRKETDSATPSTTAVRAPPPTPPPSSPHPRLSSPYPPSPCGTAPPPVPPYPPSPCGTAPPTVRPYPPSPCGTAPPTVPLYSRSPCGTATNNNNNSPRLHGNNSCVRSHREWFQDPRVKEMVDHRLALMEAADSTGFPNLADARSYTQSISSDVEALRAFWQAYKTEHLQRERNNIPPEAFYTEPFKLPFAGLIPPGVRNATLNVPRRFTRSNVLVGMDSVSTLLEEHTSKYRLYTLALLEEPDIPLTSSSPGSENSSTRPWGSAPGVWGTSGAPDTRGETYGKGTAARQSFLMQLPSFKYTRDYDPETTELVKAFCDPKFQQIWSNSSPGEQQAQEADATSPVELTKKKSLDLWDIPVADLPSHVQLSPDSKILLWEEVNSECLARNNATSANTSASSPTPPVLEFQGNTNAAGPSLEECWRHNDDDAALHEDPAWLHSDPDSASSWHQDAANAHDADFRLDWDRLTALRDDLVDLRQGSTTLHQNPGSKGGSVASRKKGKASLRLDLTALTRPEVAASRRDAAGLNIRAPVFEPADTSSKMNDEASVHSARRRLWDDCGAGAVKRGGDAASATPSDWFPPASRASAHAQTGGAIKTPSDWYPPASRLLLGHAQEVSVASSSGTSVSTGSALKKSASDSHLPSLLRSESSEKSTKRSMVDTHYAVGQNAISGVTTHNATPPIWVPQRPTPLAPQTLPVTTTATTTPDQSPLKCAVVSVKDVERQIRQEQRHKPYPIDVTCSPYQVSQHIGRHFKSGGKTGQARNQVPVNHHMMPDLRTPPPSLPLRPGGVPAPPPTHPGRVGEHPQPPAAHTQRPTQGSNAHAQDVQHIRLVSHPANQNTAAAINFSPPSTPPPPPPPPPPRASLDNATSGATSTTLTYAQVANQQQETLRAQNSTHAHQHQEYGADVSNPPAFFQPQLKNFRNGVFRAAPVPHQFYQEQLRQGMFGPQVNTFSFLQETEQSKTANGYQHQQQQPASGFYNQQPTASDSNAISHPTVRQWFLNAKKGASGSASQPAAAASQPAMTSLTTGSGVSAPGGVITTRASDPNQYPPHGAYPQAAQSSGAYPQTAQSSSTRLDTSNYAHRQRHAYQQQQQQQQQHYSTSNNSVYPEPQLWNKSNSNEAFQQQQQQPQQHQARSTLTAYLQQQVNSIGNTVTSQPPQSNRFLQHHFSNNNNNAAAAAHTQQQQQHTTTTTIPSLMSLDFSCRPETTMIFQFSPGGGGGPVPSGGVYHHLQAAPPPLSRRPQFAAAAELHQQYANAQAQARYDFANQAPY